MIDADTIKARIANYWRWDRQCLFVAFEATNTLVPFPGNGIADVLVVNKGVGPRRQNMSQYKLQSGDIILFEVEGWGILKPFVRWLLGSRWGHVGLFYTWTKRELPLIIESIGRGVMIRTLLTSNGRYVKVMRWKGDDATEVGLKIAKASERLADSASSWYDYACIVSYVLPRLICAKFNIPVPLKWHRNPFYICSEVVTQSFENAGFQLDYPPSSIVPLPSDFAQCELLETVWEGYLEAK